MDAVYNKIIVHYPNGLDEEYPAYLPYILCINAVWEDNFCRKTVRTIEVAGDNSELWVEFC